MKVSVIAVGDIKQYELLFRTSCDYIRQETTALGFEFAGGRELAPDADALFGAVAQAAETSEVIVILQSAEPEVAPLVAQTCARGLGMRAAADSSRLAMLANHARRAGRELTQEELAGFLAMPEGASAIPNTSGLVQGWYVSAAKQVMLALPAAPSELSAMFPGQVRQILSAFSGSGCASYAVLRAADLDEVTLEEALLQMQSSLNPKISWSSDSGDYEIYLEAQGATRPEADALCAAAVAKLKAQLGPYLYGEGRETLQEIVVRQYAKLGATIATAESCTGGLLSERITEVSGSSAVFEFGLSAYANRVKVEKLGVPKSFIQDYGAISRQTAAAMAIGARKRGKAEVGVGITGNAGPSADENKPVGLVYVALADEQTVWVKKLLIQRPNADRDYIRSIAALQALNMLRLYGASAGANMPGGVPVAKVMSARSVLGGLGMFGKPSPKQPAPSGETALSAVKRIQRRDGGDKNEKEADTMNRTGANPSAGKTNLIQRLKAKQLTKNDKMRLIALGACLLIFIGCMIYIGSVKLESINTAKQNTNIADIFKGEAATQEELDALPAGYLEEFATLYAQNEDIAGWIELEGTKLDYAVVQYTNNEYYSRRDFYGNNNDHGIPYVDFRCDLSIPSTNTVIYGHNMDDGQMFGELQNYRKIAYYREHPLINFHSVYYKGVYKVLGVVVCKANDEDFMYHSEINLGDTDLVNFAAEIAKRSIITTTVDVQPGDKLLTLSTCDYTFKDENGQRIARLVVFGRKVRDNEDTAVDTANAYFNPNPLMPTEWYEYIKKMQAEAELKAAQEAAAALEASNAVKWLTEEEKATLSTEDATALAKTRQEQAELYLTAAERDDELTELWEKLELIEYRTKYFALFLSNDDRARESVKTKIELADANYKLYLGVLGQEVLDRLTTWEDLQKLISSFKTVTDATLTIPALQAGAAVVNPTIALAPAGSAYKSIEWSVSGDVITIDKNTGAITANKAGTARITVKITNFDGTVVQKTIDVTVADKASAVVASATIAGLATLEPGKTIALTLSVSPATAVTSVKSVSWLCTGNDKVTITPSADGKSANVTAAADATTAPVTVTATVTSNDNSTVTSAPHTIAVSAVIVKATGVSVTPDKASVTAGQPVVFTAAVQPSTASGYTIDWVCSDVTATLTINGNSVTAVSSTAGTLTVTATLKNHDGVALPGVSSSATITAAVVTPTVTAVAINDGAKSLTVGDPAVGLSATITMSDGSAYAGSHTWSSSNPAVASVDAATGAVTAVGEGSCQITVTAESVTSPAIDVTVAAAAVAPIVTPPADSGTPPATTP